MEWALLLPLAFPGYIIAMVYVELFEYSGPVHSHLRQWFGWDSFQDYWFPPIASVGGAVTVLSLVLYPYVYLLARTAFLQQSAALLGVGRMLGKSLKNSFINVTFPLARPAIVIGVSLALMETLADFGGALAFGLVVVRGEDRVRVAELRLGALALMLAGERRGGGAGAALAPPAHRRRRGEGGAGQRLGGG